MERTLVWIVGRGGLLGSALAQAVQQADDMTLWESPHALAWDDVAALERSFNMHIDAMIDAAGSNPWAIFWAAGPAVIGSPDAMLHSEMQTLEMFLRALSTCLAEKKAASGTLVLASSAGAVYGSSDGELTEHSAASPVSAYGRHKLQQEACIAAWAERTPGATALLCRISNLYGLRQNPHKLQGFISHLSRAIIKRTPLHAYVPLSTMRDYIHVDDAAIRMLSSLRCMRQSGRKTAVKLIVSERCVSLAEIIGIFAAITKRRPPVVSAPHAVSAEHVKSVRFRSDVFPEASHLPLRSLPAGIHALHAHQLLSAQQGALR